MSDVTQIAHPFATVIGRVYGIISEYGKRPTRQLIDSFLQLTLFVNITHTHPNQKMSFGERPFNEVIQHIITNFFEKSALVLDRSKDHVQFKAEAAKNAADIANLGVCLLDNLWKYNNQGITEMLQT
jgi:hypothetical protein